MRRVWYILIPPMSLLCCSTLFILLSDEPEKLLSLSILILPMFLTSLPSPIVVLRNRIVGIAYYLLSCFSILSGAIFYSIWVLVGENTWVGLIALYGAVLSFVGFLIAVPTAVLPYIREKRGLIAKEGADVNNLSFIYQGFDNIESSFSTIRSAISSQTSDIREAIEQMRTNLACQKTELKRVQGELADARREVVELRALAELTKDQKEALLRLITSISTSIT